MLSCFGFAWTGGFPYISSISVSKYFIYQDFAHQKENNRRQMEFDQNISFFYIDIKFSFRPLMRLYIKRIFFRLK